jgi:hypothetical protein
MRVTMVKKRLLDGSECRKCREATAYLQSRGLWTRIDEIVWAQDGDAGSPGMVLGRQFGVGQAPFFIVREPHGDTVYVSVLQLVRERLDIAVTAAQAAQAIDPDDIGGI